MEQLGTSVRWCTFSKVAAIGGRAVRDPTSHNRSPNTPRRRAPRNDQPSTQKPNSTVSSWPPDSTVNVNVQKPTHEDVERRERVLARTSGRRRVDVERVGSVTVIGHPRLHLDGGTIEHRTARVQRFDRPVVVATVRLTRSAVYDDVRDAQGVHRGVARLLDARDVRVLPRDSLPHRLFGTVPVSVTAPAAHRQGGGEKRRFRTFVAWVIEAASFEGYCTVSVTSPLMCGVSVLWPLSFSRTMILCSTGGGAVRHGRRDRRGRIPSACSASGSSA